MADPVEHDPASRPAAGAAAGPAASGPGPAGSGNAEDGTGQTREALLAQHAEARARRNAAVLGSHEWEAASADVGRIEVEIARVERAMDPPRV
jgi:hypothetical protein